MRLKQTLRTHLAVIRQHPDIPPTKSNDTMKTKLLYIFPLLVAIVSSCANTSIPKPAPEQTPGGTFSGKFTLYHLHSKTGAVDSSSTNLQLTLEGSAGFKVTGDTTTLHAGSYGPYFVNSSVGNMQFNDVTFPASGSPTKVHLSGVYNYRYDGATLQMAAYGPLDTLTYYYRMTRTGN